MHPALSVIFFTVVSGTGYGLLLLLGAGLAFDPQGIGRNVALTALALGTLLTSAGLFSSMLHLGQPQRAWRALSQWRSSWLSREGVAALASLVPVAAIAWLLWRGANPAMVRAAGAALAILAAFTVFCTARIYTSLKTIPAWHNGYVLPAYLLFALLGGTVWLYVVEVLAGTASSAVVNLPLASAWLGAACAVLKRGYWTSLDTGTSKATPESATGLGRFGRVRSVEAPHTEENFLTHEMGFVLARKHSARLRLIAIILFAAVPVALAAIAVWAKSPALDGVGAIAAACAVLGGTFVERWLFFAEARHVVMLYYGAARTHSA